MRKAEISPADLTAPQKAAVLVVCLGRDLAAKVLGYLSEEEIEQLTFEMVNLGTISPEVRDHVLEEFRHVVEAQQAITVGGAEYAHQLLAQALGEDKAMEVIDRLTALLKVNPFEFARSADPAQVLSFIQDEHPQTIALILSHLPSSMASEILVGLPTPRQVEVMKRVAHMDQTSPDIIQEVERGLEKRLAGLVSEHFERVGGVDHVAEILNTAGRAAERNILEGLESDDPELVEEIRRRMFVFEDILRVNDKGIQAVLKEVENDALSLALKTASEELKKKIFGNMSERAAQLIREEMEFMGPVRVSDVEAAQQKVVDIVRRLEDAGEVVLAGKGGESDLVV